ncbi:hypothetical protein BDV18DRAFT_145741 [Aspergillus unguis]
MRQMTSQASATTRLHITPLDPGLLPLVLNASIRSVATNISFHSIPTFPENNYGYVTLPTMEADKIKKKLNGSIFKGRKFRVESARPEKQQAGEEDGQVIASSDKSSNKSKKRKAEENVLDGFELPPDRKVKRGWTESSNDKTERRKKEKRTKDKEEKKSKSQSKSKYTEKAECLFRTKVPPNRSAIEEEKPKKSSKKKAAPESVVHEFSQTMTHPTFLRSSDGGITLTSTFEEGKGWVDESGNLKEPASERVRKDQYRPGQIAGHKEKSKPKPKSATKASTDEPQTKKAKLKAESSESEDWTSSSGSSSKSDDTDSESDESATSSSSEESDASGASASPDKEQQQTKSASSEKEEPRSKIELEATSEEKSIDAETQQQQTEVHPLEALFKKPADQPKLDSEAPAQFSFFGQGDADSEDEEEDAPMTHAPLTPFSKRDLQDRGLRSAAPTPDTSQVRKMINWNPSDNRDEETSPYTDSPLPKLSAGPTEESDFTKWFWENRGDNNRAWKKRRRDAAKEQRQRENRRKGMKGKS